MRKTKIITAIITASITLTVIALMGAARRDPSAGGWGACTPSTSFTAANSNYASYNTSKAARAQTVTQNVVQTSTVSTVSSTKSKKAASTEPVSSDVQSTSPASSSQEQTIIHGQDMTYLGRYHVTGYDICVQCCGKTDGITASGVPGVVGRTCAMIGMDFGTVLYIEGIGYRVVEDRCGSGIDILCSDHEACYAITGDYNVYRVN